MFWAGLGLVLGTYWGWLPVHSMFCTSYREVGHLALAGLDRQLHMVCEYRTGTGVREQVNTTFGWPERFSRLLVMIFCVLVFERLGWIFAFIVVWGEGIWWMFSGLITAAEFLM